MALVQVSELIDFPEGVGTAYVTVKAVPGYIRRVFGTTSPAYGDGAYSGVNLANVLVSRTDDIPFKYAVYGAGGGNAIMQQPFYGAVERNPSGDQPELKITVSLAAGAPPGGAKVRAGVSIETGCTAEDKG